MSQVCGGDEGSAPLGLESGGRDEARPVPLAARLAPRRLEVAQVDPVRHAAERGKENGVNFLPSIVCTTD